MLISPRRNKLGRRFGFAHFLEVGDLRSLVVRLDNIMIAVSKIHINIPRFDRGDPVGRTNGGKREIRSTSGGHRFEEDFDGRRSGKHFGKPLIFEGRSYMEVLHHGKKEMVGKGVEDVGLKFKAKEEDLLRLRKAYVGKVRIPGSTYNIHNHFDMEGLFAIKVFSMGETLAFLKRGRKVSSMT